MVPPGPAWKTAELRGTSCLINSSHKCEGFPRTDWYTPPFASFPSRAICPCTFRVLLKFTHNLLKHRIRLWSFQWGHSLSLFIWWYLNIPPPPGTGVLGCSDNPLEMGSNDIKGEPEENTEDEEHEKAKHSKEMAENCLRVSQQGEGVACERHYQEYWRFLLLMKRKCCGTV